MAVWECWWCKKAAKKYTRPGLSVAAVSLKSQCDPWRCLQPPAQMIPPNALSVGQIIFRLWVPSYHLPVIVGQPEFLNQLWNRNLVSCRWVTCCSSTSSATSQVHCLINLVWQLLTSTNSTRRSGRKEMKEWMKHGRKWMDGRKGRNGRNWWNKWWYQYELNKLGKPVDRKWMGYDAPNLSHTTIQQWEREREIVLPQEYSLFPLQGWRTDDATVYGCRPHHRSWDHPSGFDDDSYKSRSIQHKRTKDSWV